MLNYKRKITKEGSNNIQKQKVQKINISMMEMVLDVDDITKEMTTVREEFCKYL